MTPSIVLFDLDGTISDSATGILGALQHAFDVNGLPRLDADTERGLLGPPFYESLPPIIGADRLDAVIAAYRERYATTMYDTTVFAGMPAVLEALHADGRRMAVATSKPERYAVPVVEHLGLGRWFETIGGDALDGSLRTKALVIGTVLQRLGNPRPDDVVMVGDREHDVLGAREHGIDCIGVRWGYSTPGELERVAPAAIVATPEQLADTLGVSVSASC